MTIRGGKQMPFLKIKEQQLKRKYDTPIKQAINTYKEGLDLEVLRQYCMEAWGGVYES